jgi:hypothetical protein
MLFARAELRTSTLLGNVGWFYGCPHICTSSCIDDDGDIKCEARVYALHVAKV